jgi:hypothetical protein
MKTKQMKPIGTSTVNFRGLLAIYQSSMFNVLLTLLLAVTGSACATGLYVWQDSPSPWPLYTSWTSAAHVIQDAVEAALPGDEIVVTNGTCATGGRAVGTNVLVNRVAVDKPLTLWSVNGPPVSVSFQSSASRLYTLFSTTDLTGEVWTPMPGQTDIPGNLAQHTLTDPAPGATRFYRVGVTMP